ncbi:pyridoxal phosphate-dependent transferase [Xylaria flabelliformis]|nr:pyridoxal phosphate-dependent transferase [Xylaria flabelliformis]
MKSTKQVDNLEVTLRGRLAQREYQGRLRHLDAPIPGVVDFSSNDYLSFSQNLILRKALITQLGVSSEKTPLASSNGRALGSGGSRLLDGNSAFVEQLERKISEFHRSEAALLFTSAYDANVGLISCVPGAEDVILYDNLIHASIHDGMRLSRATRKISFAHESIIRQVRESEVDLKENGGSTGVKDSKGLERTLKQLIHSDERIRSGKSNIFICLEALYSMDGDIADLQYVCSVVEFLLPNGNGYIIVDEAHSVGVLGDGRGLVCQLGLQDRIWARVVGFGKAIGCAGGGILCSSIARLYLINYARTLIYTTSMSFPSLASINAVYDYLISGEAEKHQQQLQILIQHCHVKLRSLYVRFKSGAAGLGVPDGTSGSPIIPVFTRYPKSLARHCQTSGFMVRPIVAPTVPHGQERVRICIHAANTIEQIDSLCRSIETWLDYLGTMQAADTRGKSQIGDASGAVLATSLREKLESKL